MKMITLSGSGFEVSRIAFEDIALAEIEKVMPVATPVDGPGPERVR